MARTRQINSVPEALEDIYSRLRDVEDVARRRSLPPGYEFSVTATQVIITRTADGATAALELT